MAVAILLVIMLVAGLVLPLVLDVGAASTKTKIEDLKDKQKQLADEKKQIQAEIGTLRNDKDSAIKEKNALDHQIRVMEEEVETLNSLIAEYNTEIAKQQADLEVAEQDGAAQYQVYLERLRAIEEMGSASYLGVVLKADSLSDMLSLNEDVNALVKFDRDLMASMKRKRESIQANKKELEDNKQQMTASKAEQQQRQDELIAEYAQTQKRVKDLEANEANLEKIYADKEAAEKTLQSDISSLMAKLAEENKVYVGGSYLFPLPSQYRGNVTDTYGYRIHPILKTRRLHTGTDYGAPKNTPVYAANSGTVARANYNTAYGNMVVIDHGGGKATLYGHMTRYIVSAGQKVSRGDVIGYVGSTGWSTGNHLHFEIHEGGTTKDPQSFF